MKKVKSLTLALTSLLAVSALTACAKQEEFSPGDGRSDIAERLTVRTSELMFFNANCLPRISM